MSILILKTLHLAGAFGLLAALGAICLGGSRKAGSILHGISLVLILLVGFAMLKKPPMDHYWWMAKLVLWLVLGATPAIAKRGSKTVALVIALACATGAAFLGLAKPF